MYDVAIIGAGVTGGMIARELSKYALRVLILEKENDVAMGATKANSAIVHAGFDAKEGSLKAKLNVEGSKMFRSLCEDLGVKYINNGSLVVGFDEEDYKTLLSLLERGKKNGVEGLEILNQKQVRELEPNISDDVLYALYAPTGAITCPYELTIAAIGNAMDNGVELRTGFCVREILSESDGYRICSESESVCARVVINAAGVFADTVAEQIADSSFKIHPRKGEYLLFDREWGTHVRHTIFRTPTKLGKGILVSPTVDGNLILGPTAEDGTDKGDKSTTREGLQAVQTSALQLVKNLRMNGSITSFCGLRAVGDTGDFIIRSPRPGFIHVAGIESPGLTASPAIARYAVHLLKDAGFPLTEKASWNGQRRSMTYFKDASTEEKNRMIQENPAYGKIVCRCEKVSEGEILEALRTNPKPHDLDGIKRRTRAQMGRCQGGFCMPYIAELLAAEEHLDFTEITKSGKGSEIVSGFLKGEEKHD